MTAEIVNPPAMPQPIGYNHGVVMNGSRILFIAGQVGLGDRGAPGDLVTQFSRALAHVREVVTLAGGTVEQIGRLTIFVKNVREYRECRGELRDAYRAVFGRHFPAMSLVQAGGFIDTDIEIEIEATAVLP
jgi:enamine deaminase RidA (YjgF/YER057c/UK114 family)